MPRRDDSSDSAGRDRKRKREKEKNDKKDKEKKEKERDRRHRDDRGDEKKSDRRKREDVDGDHRGYGYGHGQDDRDRRRNKQDRDRSRSRDQDRDRGRDKGRDRDKGGNDVDKASKSEAAPPPVQKAQNWREEVNDAEDERDFSDDEEVAAKKLAESRARRAAMMQQSKKPDGAVSAGEADDDVASQGRAHSLGGWESGAPPSSTLQTPEAEPFVPSTEPQLSASTLAAAAEAEAKAKAAQKQEEEDAAAGGDMFDISEAAAAKLKDSAPRPAHNIGLTGASTDDWDDGEGYYQATIGEVLEERYIVQEALCGKGVFSNVVKCRDTKEEGEPLVAIKVIRSNDMMKKAAEKEVEILQLLNREDKGSKRHIIRLIETFYYRKHIFMVFECMADDLRGALKKLTKGKGMALPAVKAYSKQLMVAVRHMHKFSIIHADIKPDNILISENQEIVKLCDFGTAFEVKDAMVSPYLMSRFYRPAEVILGCKYSTPVDVWAMGCTLYEIFTAKTLLQGKTNNDMLKRIMDLKGKIPRGVIRTGAVWKQHFDDNLDFKYEDSDKLTKETITRIITDNSAKKELKELILERVGPEKRQSDKKEDQEYVKKAVHFADFLDRLLALDPEKRLTAEDSLKHHFFAEPTGPKVAAEKAAAAKKEEEQKAAKEAKEKASKHHHHHHSHKSHRHK